MNLAVKGHLIEGSWQKAGKICANDTERLLAGSVVIERLRGQSLPLRFATFHKRNYAKGLCFAGFHHWNYIKDCALLQFAIGAM